MEKRFGIKTILVSFCCLLGAISGGYFLYFDLNTSGTAGTGKVIGKIEKRESTVRRKAASSYVWTNVQNNEELFRKDSIQTAAGAAASVRLGDGSLLDIYENSLVVMEDSTNLSVQFLRGTAVVHQETGDKKVSVGKDGRAKIEELSVRLLKPETLARFFVTDRNSKEILFSWELKGKVPSDPMTLQISTDKRFNPQFTQSVVIQNFQQRSIKINLAYGNYFWRILTKNSVLSEHRPFKIMNAIPLQPIVPDHEAKMTLLGAEAPIQFRWVNPHLSGQEEIDVSQGEHHLELSKDPQFLTISFNEEIHAALGMTGIKNVQTGTYYWRIRSKYGDTQTLSSVRSIHVTRTNSPPAGALTPSPTPSLALASPLVAKPELGMKLNLLDKKNPIEATWDPVEGAQFYEVTVYSDSQKDHKKTLVLRTETDKTRLDLKKLGPGDYLWTVRSVDKQKQLFSRPLPWMKFSLTYGEVLQAPQVTSSEVQ